MSSESSKAHETGSATPAPSVDGDALYKYDEALHRRICDQKPWKSELRAACACLRRQCALVA